MSSPSLINIPELGNITIKNFAGSEGRKFEAKILSLAFEPELGDHGLSNSIANLILASMIIPPKTVENIANLSESTVTLLIYSTIDELNIRKEYETLPTNLPVRERFFQAYRKNRVKLLRESKDVIENEFPKLLEQKSFMFLYLDLNNLLEYSKEVKTI